MSKFLKGIVTILTILTIVEPSFSLLTPEEYAEIQANATFETLPYEKYVEIFKNKPPIGSGEVLNVNERLEIAKQHQKSYLSNFQSPNQAEFLAEVKNADPIVIPYQFDWREANRECFEKHPIKDQAHCGSCYAFATTYTLAKRYCINKKNVNDAYNVDLSPQDLLACDFKHRMCKGGIVPVTWEFLEDEGVVSEDCRPYLAGKDQYIGNCKRYCENYMTSYKKYKAVKGSMVEVFSELDIKYQLYTRGPMTTEIDAYDDLTAYQGGIYFHIPRAGEKFEGHAVTVVGWGYDSRIKANYWIIANSWGKDWGENGYFRIPFRHSNVCPYAVASDPFF